MSGRAAARTSCRPLYGHLYGRALTRPARDRCRGASLVPMSVPARGGPRRKEPRVAPPGRVTYRRYVVGPRPGARDRSAGDSSPVTPGGRIRGRPDPAASGRNGSALGAVRPRPSARTRPAPDTADHHRHGTAPPASGHHRTGRCDTRHPVQRRPTPRAPPLGTGAALTPVPTAKGPAETLPRGPSCGGGGDSGRRGGEQGRPRAGTPRAVCRASHKFCVSSDATNCTGHRSCMRNQRPHPYPHSREGPTDSVPHAAVRRTSLRSS